MASVADIVQTLNNEILNPVVALLFALAFLYFTWGIIKFISNSDSSDGRKQGKDSMIWGVVGMFIMVGVWGILSITINSLGIPTP